LPCESRAICPRFGNVFGGVPARVEMVCAWPIKAVRATIAAYRILMWMFLLHNCAKGAQEPSSPGEIIERSGRWLPDTLPGRTIGAGGVVPIVAGEVAPSS
jgi:hypothetical protein